MPKLKKRLVNLFVQVSNGSTVLSHFGDALGSLISASCGGHALCNLKLMNMKFFLFSCVLTTFASAAAHADDLPVSLTLSGDHDITLTASSFLSHPRVTLKGGQATISTEGRGLIYNSSFRLLTSDGNAIDFKVPKKYYTNPAAGKAFALSVPASDTGQGVGLRGDQSERNIETWQEMRREDCSYEKYTYDCGSHSSVMSKHMSGCGMGYFTYEDKKDVIVTYLKVEKSFSGSLVAADGKTIATLAGQAAYSVSETDEADASECGGWATAAARAGLKPHTSLVHNPAPETAVDPETVGNAARAN